MDHSLQGYLERQTTEVLTNIREQYRQQEEDPYDEAVIEMIAHILKARKQL